MEAVIKPKHDPESILRMANNIRRKYPDMSDETIERNVRSYIMECSRSYRNARRVRGHSHQTEGQMRDECERIWLACRDKFL